MPRKVFRARPGSMFNDEDATVIGHEVDRLQKGCAIITPEMFVDAAKPSNSPIHEYFDWDDKSAAQKHRLHFARLMIGSILVEYSADMENAEPVRAYYNVIDQDDEKGRGYVSLQSVLTNEDYRMQVVQGALREAQSWAERFRLYSELAPIVKAVDNLTANRDERAPRRRRDGPVPEASALAV